MVPTKVKAGPISTNQFCSALLDILMGDCRVVLAPWNFLLREKVYDFRKYYPTLYGDCETFYLGNILPT